MEDELLKAGIAKYGYNSWDRCASLLNSGKSAAQCKSRWFNWLDPTIKKTEWTWEEDQILLRLCSVFRYQWKTISNQMPGRTQDQCIKRAQELEDMAKDSKLGRLGGEGDGQEERSKYDVSNQVVSGMLDTEAESRAARPDPP